MISIRSKIDGQYYCGIVSTDANGIPNGVMVSGRNSNGILFFQLIGFGFYEEVPI